MTRSSRKKPFAFFLWHRRLGLLALAFIFILSITGIMLNHTEYLAMDETHIESDLLLNWYELNPTGEPVSYKAEQHVITQWDNQLFYNSDTLFNNKNILIGAVLTNEMIVLALDRSILLLNTSGEIIEHINMPIKFDRIKKIGVLSQSVVIQTNDEKIFLADEDILNWQVTKSDNINWSATSPLDDAQKEKLKQAYRGQGLSLERVILDLHSGRLFSSNWGIYIMDGSAIIMILLSLSGFWVWFTRRQKMKLKRRHHASGKG